MEVLSLKRDEHGCWYALTDHPQQKMEQAPQEPQMLGSEVRCMNMARYEQETIISFNEEEKTAGIYTHNKILRQKLAALARDRPEDCRLVKASRSGRVVDYTIPKSWIKIVPPRTASEAQKAALARARKAASKPL